MPLPSVCRSTHSRNFSFGTTMRFPIRREGNPFSCISSYPLEEIPQCSRHDLRVQEQRQLIVAL